MTLFISYKGIAMSDQKNNILLRVYKGIKWNIIDMIEQNKKKIEIYLSCIWIFERKEMKK